MSSETNVRSGTWHVVVPNGVDVAIDQFVYFSLWPSDSDNESSQTRARARGAICRERDYCDRACHLLRLKF